MISSHLPHVRYDVNCVVLSPLVSSHSMCSEVLSRVIPLWCVWCGMLPLLISHWYVVEFMLACTWWETSGDNAIYRVTTSPHCGAVQCTTMWLCFVLSLRSFHLTPFALRCIAVQCAVLLCYLRSSYFTPWAEQMVCDGTSRDDALYHTAESTV